MDISPAPGYGRAPPLVPAEFGSSPEPDNESGPTTLDNVKPLSVADVIDPSIAGRDTPSVQAPNRHSSRGASTPTSALKLGTHSRGASPASQLRDLSPLTDIETTPEAEDQSDNGLIATAKKTRKPTTRFMSTRRSLTKKAVGKADLSKFQKYKVITKSGK
ncbi:hypothetical protein BD626DRAFT_576389 [Schizophyllum amplum]|uniref:Uncharacterized protein n=1 Tax=Schizophyllum amplum TaxID=97359 RepID=A0A550BTP4_9AGAR|nr:hypothetical protein BD626DRAFT_576389 [Auriculariopsis ampla]